MMITLILALSILITATQMHAFVDGTVARLGFQVVVHRKIYTTTAKLWVSRANW